jgi:hypothetical protein
MTPEQLLRRIRKLPEFQPRTIRLELDLAHRGTVTGVSQYSSQKQHWISWLDEYDGPGYYGRRDWNRTAEFVYNHVICPPMVLWLGEAVGTPRRTIRAAASAALAAPANMMSQAAEIRRLVPWSEIEVRLGT